MRKPLIIFLILAVSVGAVSISDLKRPLPGAGDDTRIVEVAVFEGGYGIEWHTRIAEKFNEENKHRNIKIELWGDPRTSTIIKPRILRGDPPDLILDERLPLWLLIGAGKLRSFTEALEQPSPGDDIPWGERYSTSMLDMFRSDGEVYAVPAAYGAWICWYDAALFRKHGWHVPDTWDEFLTLCENIKAKGIAPIALQGKYSVFYAWNTYIALVQRVGGLQAINRINALEPGAFSHPDVVKASRLFQNLVADYFQPGAMAMNHTESQYQFIIGKTALVFCGIWLENEMKANIPPGFDLKAFNLPGNPEWKGNPALVHGEGMEFLFVPTDARYPDIAFEFARYLVSPQNAADMAESIGVISPLAKATPPESVTPALRSVLEIINTAPSIFNVRPNMLFPAWRAQVMNAAIQGLCRGELTPEEFGRALDDGIAQSVSTSELAIPAAVLYDPAAFGEPVD
jgi:N-acetylglucosamine transport system substrate-binding protein